MMQISATIITFNEADKIERCLQSLKGIADEIIVLDSGSTDQTVAIAERLGAKCAYRTFDGHIQQKNHALELTTHDWTLSLDADECLSVTLRDRLLELKSTGTPHDAHQVNRLNNFCGQWIRHGGWYPDRKIRLFKKSCAVWGGLNPHDKIVMRPGSSVGRLKGDILHYTYDQEADFAAQNVKFAKSAALAMLKSGKKANLFTPFWRAAFRWVKGYLLQAGFLDGRAGWLIAAGNAQYTFDKYLQLHQFLKQQDVR